MTLPPDLREWLDTEARRQGVGRSEALVRVLREAKTAHTGLSAPAPAFAAPTPALPTSPPSQTSSEPQTLTATQRQLRGALKLAGAVAEYDTYERRWVVGFAGAPATLADLEALTVLGVLVRSGEGLGAVYRLA